jgi:hypothetical protein
MSARGPLPGSAPEGAGPLGNISQRPQRSVDGSGVRKKLGNLWVEDDYVRMRFELRDVLPSD